MKWYQYEITGIMKKTMWVEANSEEEAEALALEEDMDKNPDYYEKTALLLEADYEDH